MKYAIDGGDANDAIASDASYDSLEQARAALRARLGWAEVYLGPGYTTRDGANQVWHAYRTAVESWADSMGASAVGISRRHDG
jgi:hypothetical protein